MKLLNPYCGLPLCVGWSAHRAASVEALEAARAWRETAAAAYGIDNHGNKRQGEPCQRCALRTRCGGAWHAYWEERDGRGLAPPLTRRGPWWPEATSWPGQTVVGVQQPRGAANGVAAVLGRGITQAVLDRLGAADTPTVWLLAGGLAAGDAARIVASGCTDVGLLLAASDLLEPVLGDELAQLQSANAGRDEQLRIRVTLGLRALGSFELAFRALRVAATRGVDAVDLLMVPGPRHRRFVAAVQAELPRLAMRIGEPTA